MASAPVPTVRTRRSWSARDRESPQQTRWLSSTIRTDRGSISSSKQATCRRGASSGSCRLARFPREIWDARLEIGFIAVGECANSPVPPGNFPGNGRIDESARGAWGYPQGNLGISPKGRRMSVLLFCNYSKCRRIASCFLPGMLDAFRFHAMGTSTANRPTQPNRTNQKGGKMRRFFAVVAILSLLAMIGCAGDDGAPGPAGTSAVDKGTISGTVKDGVGVGIAGVSVNTVPATPTATTAADGSFSLANVPIGAYTVTASGAGYTPGSVAGVSVAAGAPSSVSIPLSSQPPAAASVTGKVVAITGVSP